jgi:uncharacterized protein (DUF58 family)
MLTSELVRKTRLIEIFTRHLVNDTFAGRYQAIFKGRGIEFEEVRPYSPGDEVRTIDWNVTARMGEPYVKRHVEERELSVMLAVDASGSGEFGTFDRFKRELAAELAAVLAFAATTSNDRVGLLIFTDSVELFIPPRKGRRHVTRLIREMLAFQPRGLGTDIALALDTISKVLKRRSIIFLISDFLAEPAGYSRPLFATARRHDVVAMELNDPLEREIPDVGLLALEDAETGEIVWLDSGDAAWRKGFEDRVEQLEDGKRQAFSSARVDRVSVSTDQDYLPPLIAFFRRRSRRIARGAVRPGLA